MERSGDRDPLLDDLCSPSRFRTLSRLGVGSVGVVERIFDARLGRVLARKTLREELLGDRQSLRTFLNEARILGQLDHGSIIPIFDTYLNEAGAPVYTMREISGRSLSRVLRVDRATGDAKPLPVDRSLRIVQQLCAALAHAHERGVVHLDLKPENIIVLEHDRVVLVDWGAARVFDPERTPSWIVAEAREGAVLALEEEDEFLIGTPRYMSPEQTRARRSELGPESDVFSLGVIFYQMLTGRLPFRASDLDALLQEVRESTPPAPHELDAGIHPRLGQIVMRMLEKREWERFETMEAVLADLTAFRSSAAEFPLREFEAGELVFAEGEDGDHAGIVVSGEIEIWTEQGGARRILGRVVAGEAIGELALLSEGARSASATALTPVSMRVISADALRSEREKLSPWVLAILNGVVERFIDRSDRLIELLRQSD
jgi:serine/threonine-protein kinase